jgi:hypothetical protein
MPAREKRFHILGVEFELIHCIKNVLGERPILAYNIIAYELTSNSIGIVMEVVNMAICLPLEHINCSQ